MLISDGRLVTKTPEPPRSFTPAESWWWNYESQRRWRAYGELYRCQLWVYVVVAKRARATARLPLKVYRRDNLNRPEAEGHPYHTLMSNPNPALGPFRFWEWTSSTYDTYGEAFWLKRRDRGGRPFQLVPLHPTCLTWNDQNETWRFDNGKKALDDIPPTDLVHFRSWNPSTNGRGMSPLEPLRDTLENETFARIATSSFWRRGARPGTALVHPGRISQEAMDRLKAQYDGSHAGAGNTGSTVVLEEGMEPKALTVTAEEAQYIETRKLNREEVCGAYDMPPPAVHILDRATFSNITEQFRSVYRDTMAPHLGGFESDMESQLRAPDFGDEVYAEFLMDEVLRGDFETRTAALETASYLTIAEKRRIENLPFIEGTDRIFVNAATVPLDEASRAATPPAVNAQSAVRSVMGRLSWQKTLDEVDAATLVDGLDDLTALHVKAALVDSVDVAGLRDRVRAIGGAS